MIIRDAEKEEMRNLLDTHPCILKFLIQHGYKEFCESMYNENPVSILEEMDIWDLLVQSPYFRGYIGKDGKRTKYLTLEGEVEFFECRKKPKRRYDISLMEHLNVWDSATDDYTMIWRDVKSGKGDSPRKSRNTTRR
jgi:hypothetical protein